MLKITTAVNGEVVIKLILGSAKTGSSPKVLQRKSPKEIINAILEQVSAFANGQPKRDDETLLVMRVEAG